MDSNQSTQVEALNEYIIALQRQIKSFQNEREILLQQLTKTEKINDKSDHELHQLRNDLKQMNSIIYRQTVEKINTDNQMKFLTQENDKLKKQTKYNDQKIDQLNNVIKEKSDLLAKEKNNTYLTSTFYSKQIAGLEEKIKQLEKKLSSMTQQKLVSNVQLNLAQKSLLNQKEVIEKLNTEIQKSNVQVQGLRKQDQLNKSRIQALFLKLKVYEEEKEKLNFEIQQLTAQVQSLRKQGQLRKNQIQTLLLQISHGNQDSLELKKSYESLIQSMKSKYEQKLQYLNGQIQSQKSQIQRLKEETDILKQSIQGLNTSLALETANCQLQYQKCKELSQQITQLNKEIQKLQKQVNDEVTDKVSALSGKEKEFQELMKKFNSLEQELQRKQRQKQVDLENSNQKYLLLQRQSQLEIQKKQQQINRLNESLSLKILKITELNQSRSQTQSKLLEKTREHEQKVRQCQFLNKKQKQVESQLETFRVEMQELKNDGNSESLRMRNKIEELDSQIVEFLKRETKVAKQLKQTESKQSRTLQEFEQYKKNSQQRQSQANRKLRQIQRQLQLAKRQFQQKEQRLRVLVDQSDFKSKQHANKQQQLLRKCSDLQGKCWKLKSKLNQAEKQLQQKDQDHNKLMERLLVQHKNQLKDNRINHEEQAKQLKNRMEEQITQLTSQLEEKSKIIKQLQEQIHQLKKSSLKLQLDHSAMETKIIILQQQLQSAQNRTDSNNQNFINFQKEIQQLKEQLAQKQLQLEIITPVLEKTRKDNQWLYNEATHLREQVDALQSSTTYLKRQIASALDKHQGSLKEIRLLKETNRQISRLASTKTILTDRSDVIRRARAKTMRMQIAQSNFSIDNDIKSMEGQDHNDTKEESEAMHPINLDLSPKEQVKKMLKWFKKESNDGDFL